MPEHPIQELMTITLENLKEMVEVNTIIGEPVESPDGSVIIPVSKLRLGFAAGGSAFITGSDESSSDELPFGGGSSGGVSISPVAFLIVNKKETKMIYLNENTQVYEKIIESAPEAIDKIRDMLKTTLHTENKETPDTNFEI